MKLNFIFLLGFLLGVVYSSFFWDKSYKEMEILKNAYEQDATGCWHQLNQLGE